MQKDFTYSDKGIELWFVTAEDIQTCPEAARILEEYQSIRYKMYEKKGAMNGGISGEQNSGELRFDADPNTVFEFAVGRDESGQPVLVAGARALNSPAGDNKPLDFERELLGTIAEEVHFRAETERQDASIFEVGGVVASPALTSSIRGFQVIGLIVQKHLIGKVMEMADRDSAPVVAFSRIANDNASTVISNVKMFNNLSSMYIYDNLKMGDDKIILAAFSPSPEYAKAFDEIIREESICGKNVCSLEKLRTQWKFDRRMLKAKNNANNSAQGGGAHL